jgi:hypothetical protein
MAKTRSQDGAPSASLAVDPELTNRGRARSRSETRVDAKEAVDLAYVTTLFPFSTATRPSMHAFCGSHPSELQVEALTLRLLFPCSVLSTASKENVFLFVPNLIGTSGRVLPQAACRLAYLARLAACSPTGVDNLAPLLTLVLPLVQAMLASSSPAWP